MVYSIVLWNQELNIIYYSIYDRNLLYFQSCLTSGSDWATLNYCEPEYPHCVLEIHQWLYPVAPSPLTHHPDWPSTSLLHRRPYGQPTLSGKTMNGNVAGWDGNYYFKYMAEYEIEIFFFCDSSIFVIHTVEAWTAVSTIQIESLQSHSPNGVLLASWPPQVRLASGPVWQHGWEHPWPNWS